MIDTLISVDCAAALLSGVFSWGVFLAGAARWVFGATGKTVLIFFLVGTAISMTAVSFSALYKGLLNQGSSSSAGDGAMQAYVGGTFPKPEDRISVVETIRGILVIPFFIGGIAISFRALRCWMLRTSRQVSGGTPCDT